MLTSHGHLSYCTNIHAGENWPDHFAALRNNVPAIKKQISPAQSFGIGLRLSHQASLTLLQQEELDAFKTWLKQEDCYVFTMNGFPYGGFHNTRVKDQVHAPDWTSPARVAYTIRLFDILSELLPAGVVGGISTSPLSYKYWHTPDKLQHAFKQTTDNIFEVISHLVHLRKVTGKLLHLDIEPEPDGLLESGSEFFEWFDSYALPLGKAYLQKHNNITEAQAHDAIRDHLQLCYDICHFAVGYEDHATVIGQLHKRKIKVGKVQISAALKAEMPAHPAGRKPVIEAFRQFNENTYLHQVVARQATGTLKRYPDLPEALSDAENEITQEWRAHFHVPLFVQDYGLLHATQEDIQKVLTLHRTVPFTNHLEVETYTWDVLPDALKAPLQASIIRELQWVARFLEH